MKIHALSYNLHKGFSSGNRRFVLRKMRERIEAVHADLVFLQEVQGHHSGHARKQSEWPTQAQFEFLADRLWPHFAYGKNAVYEAGHHGNAILSKIPIIAWENFDLSVTRFERRGILHAILKHPRSVTPIHAACLHLNLLESDRKVQLGKVRDWLVRRVPRHEPLLLAGDFNDWRRQTSATLQRDLGLEELFLTLQGKHAKTFPSFYPILPLDRIYYRGMTPLEGTVHEGEPWSELSDHLPVSGVLKLKE